MVYLVRQGETDWNLFKKFKVSINASFPRSRSRKKRLPSERY
jgi:broad specificity phosphatase PhoE